MDPPPQVLVGPVGQRVVLPQAAPLVAFDQLGLRPRRALLAADAGDPALGAGERAFQRRDLRDRAAVLRAAPRLRRGCSRPAPRSSRRSAPRTRATSAASRRTARRCRSSRSSPPAGGGGGHLLIRAAAARRSAPTPPSGTSTAAPPARRGAPPRAACGSGSAPGRARRRLALRWLSMWVSVLIWSSRSLAFVCLSSVCRSLRPIPRTRPRRESLRRGRCGSSR